MLELDELGHLHQMMARPGYSLYPFGLGIASSLRVEIGGKDMGSVIELVRQRLCGSETLTKLH